MCELMKKHLYKILRVLSQPEYFAHRTQSLKFLLEMRLFSFFKKCILNTQNSFAAPFKALLCGLGC